MDSVILKLITINTLGILVFSTVSSFIPIFLSNRGYSAPEIGFIYALGALVVLLMPVFSLLADHLGKRKFLQLSFIFTSISFVGYTINAYLGKIADSLSYASWVMRAAIADLTPKKILNSTLARLGSTELLAISCGIVLGGILIQHLGFNSWFYAAAVINLILGLFFIPKFTEKHRLTSIKPEWHFPKPLLVVCGLSFLWGTGSGIMGLSTPLLFSDFFQINIIKIGALISITALAYSLPPLLAGKNMDKLQARNLLGVSCFLSFVFSIILFFNRSFPSYYILAIIQSSLLSFIPSTLDRLIVDSSRSKHRAFDISFAKTTYFLGNGLGAILFGYMVSMFGLFGGYLVQAVELILMAALLFI